jgi:hypothetical protein
MNRDALNRIHDEHCDRLLPAYVNGSLDLATRAGVAAHLARCADCRAELAAWRAVADAAEADAASIAPPAYLLDRVFARIEREGALAPSWQERIATMLQWNRRRLIRPLVGVAAAALVAGAVIATPIGGAAQGFLTIFTPKQVAFVPVTESELQTLPDLKDYGTVVQPAHAQPIHVGSVAAASARAGYSVAAPADLPTGAGAPSYEVLPSQSGSFTFSAAKAKAAAARNGKALPSMPANIDGASVQVTTGTAVIATYPSTKEKTTVTVSGKTETMPALIVGEMAAPTVQSTGVSAQELEQYLLAQPGISPQLAQAIRAIGDPGSTLPIPIPVDKAASHPIQVQGVSGLSLADSTGLGGGIIWEKNGMIYGVAGPYSESQLLAIANSLH